MLAAVPLGILLRLEVLLVLFSRLITGVVVAGGLWCWRKG